MTQRQQRYLGQLILFLAFIVVSKDSIQRFFSSSHNDVPKTTEDNMSSSHDVQRASQWKHPNHNESSDDDDDDDDHDRHNNLGLDFAVIGFPKTGTTYFQLLLNNHPEVVMPTWEFCEIHADNGVDATMAWLQNASSSSRSLSSSFSSKKPSDSENENESSRSRIPISYGIKCPTMIRQTNAIDNLVKMSDHTRLVVGVRHPVLWFESFYNYRVYEHYKFNRTTERIPQPIELVDGKSHWLDASTNYARFDIFLRQLAKVPISQKEMQYMLSEQQWPKSISPNPYKVFIYTMDQIHDSNSTRQTAFRTDFQNFLRLETPFSQNDGKEKVNSHNTTSFAEHINICEEKFTNIRKKLVKNGKVSSRWIINQFIESKDVVVSNKGHFKEAVRTWAVDPCLTRT